MILSDRGIQARLGKDILLVPPVDKEQLQPASIDLRLGTSFVRFREVRAELDVRDPKGFSHVQTKCEVPEGSPIKVVPGEFLLAVTKERVRLPADLAARVEGRSSLGRLGLAVHVTAGFIDPGFDGFITLELANLNRYPLVIYPGMRIAQIAFEVLSSSAERPYGHADSNSKYQHQTGATPTRIADELG